MVTVRSLSALVTRRIRRRCVNSANSYERSRIWLVVWPIVDVNDNGGYCCEKCTWNSIGRRLVHGTRSRIINFRDERRSHRDSRFRFQSHSGRGRRSEG